MKELYEFYKKNTIKVEDIPEVPTIVLKKWVDNYNKLPDTEKGKMSFQDYVEEYSCVLADGGYKRVKDFDLFILDKKDPTNLFNTVKNLSYQYKQEYFRELFEQTFIEKGSEYNTKKLKEWINSTVSHFKKDAYLGLVSRLDEMDDKEELKEILLSLFVCSLGIEVYGFFDLINRPIPTLDEAEFLIANFVDCTDPNVSVDDKLEYIRVYGNADSRIIRKVLYKMSSMVDYFTERRSIIKLTSLKDKKIHLGLIKQLSEKNQDLFCKTWQTMTGK